MDDVGTELDPALVAGDVAEVRVPDRPDSVRAARVFLSKLLDGWGVDEASIDDASLLTSELMTNAVRHGTGKVELCVEAQAGQLHVAVHDNATQAPVVTDVGPASLGGRGMWIVQSIAQDWGADVDDSGKTVWFELTMGQADSPEPSED